jgi:hypothetical protein
MITLFYADNFKEVIASFDSVPTVRRGRFQPSVIYLSGLDAVNPQTVTRAMSLVHRNTGAVFLEGESLWPSKLV